jgi:ATP-binding cassette subfamily G (WHITE) protein 2 (SNQ2)
MVYPIGFGKGAAGLNGTGIQLLVILFMELFGVTLGQLIGAISPSVQVAVLANPFLTLVLTTFCGVTIPFPTMPIWARSWLYYLDPYSRTLGAMVSTELQYVPAYSSVQVLVLIYQQRSQDHVQS